MHLHSRHVTIGAQDQRAAGDPRELLLTRRRQLVTEIQVRAKDVREAGATQERPGAALEEDRDSCADDDMALAMIRMRVDMLARVDEAVRQCEAGTYGHCSDCGRRIAAARLNAMPFAVRCRECQERCDEHGAHCHRHARRLAQVLGESRRGRDNF